MKTIITAILATALLSTQAIAEDALAAEASEGNDQTGDEQTTLEEITEILKAINELRGTQGNQVTGATTTGQFEMEVLAFGAVGTMARLLSDDICEGTPSGCAGKTLILTEAETFSFGMHSALMNSINRFGSSAPGMVSFMSSTPLELIGAISQVASLLRNERTLTDYTVASVDADMVVDALAAAINAKNGGHTAHVLGGSPGVYLPAGDFGEPDFQSYDNLPDKVAWLFALRTQIRGIPEGSRSDDQEKWLAAFEPFYLEITKRDDKGNTPVGNAVAALAIENDLKRIIRVDVHTAGGTMTTSKNFGTVVLGLDPFRVTGGATASYTEFDVRASELSRPTDWGAVTCSTDDMRLDVVRTVNFDTSSSAKCNLMSPST